MNPTPGFINGHPISPKLTPEQEVTVRDMLAEGKTLEATAKAANCTIGRVRQYRDKTLNAKAIRDLQISTNLVKGHVKLTEIITRMVEVVTDLESRVTNTNQELRKISKAVEYQKLALTKKRTEVRDLKREKRELKAFIHRTTGNDMD